MSEILIARPLTVNKGRSVFSLHTKLGLKSAEHKKRGRTSSRIAPPTTTPDLDDSVETESRRT